MPSLIDKMIGKYAGQDDAYANKLKLHVRDMFGYSNYMSKLEKQLSKPADIGDVSGLSPVGIRRRISSRYGMQRENVGTLKTAANAIDTTAGQIGNSLAAELAKKNRAADQYRYDSSFVYNPEDELDEKILEYAKNPYKEDGSIKTVEELEAWLRAEYAGLSDSSDESVVPRDPFMQEQRSGAATPKFDEKAIRERIINRLPQDFEGKERMYSYRFNGMNEKQAAKEQMIDYANLIASGRGNEVPPELYPAAYSLLSDSEKAALRGIKKLRATTVTKGGEREL